MPVVTQPVAADFGRANILFRARARRHWVDDFPGPLSVKAVMDGRVAWTAEGRERVVDEASFLVLNAGQPYSMRIDEARPQATCCLFFAGGFVEGVRAALLDPDPDGVGAAPHHFAAGLRPADERLLPRIRMLAASGAATAGWREEQFLEAARDLALLDAEFARRVARVPAARAATREECLRRLERAREFLHAHAAAEADLAEAARAACLSPFHFHRLFRQTFGLTPHQYRTGLRLERARRRLELGCGVTEACLDAGFESLGSFSTLFRRKFGAPPSAWQKSKFEEARRARPG